MFILKGSVAGRVQRVMFRDFAKRKAKKLKIKGYVRNTSDGKLEFVACSDKKEVLLEFLECLKVGPSLAQVEHIDFSLKEDSEGECLSYKTFFIKYKNILDRL